MSKIIYAEFIFWLHTVVLILVSVSGLFIDWYWVVLVLLLIKAQQYYFHGCLLTLWESREGGIKKGTAYYQLAAKRFFGIKLSRMGVRVVSSLQVAITLIVVIVANIYNIRLNL